MKKLTTAALVAASVVGLSACTSAADTANENLSKAAENFEVPRSVEGFCSSEVGGSTFEVICLVDRANDEVERTTLHLSDNVTFVSTQMGGVKTDLFQPRIIFRPETIIPDFDLSTSNR
jgi:hypothetical protein